MTLLAIGTLLGCAGVPRKQPPAQLVRAAPLDGLGAPMGGAWPAADWWKSYEDPLLDQLIELGAADSPSLASAHARFESAQQSVRLAAAATGAHIDANADVERQRLSDNGLFPPRLLGFTWYDQADLGLQARYTFDWWGKQKFAVDAALDQAHAAQADRSAALLVLAGSIADTYFGWQADAGRLRLAREKEKVLEQAAALAGARVNAELDSPDSVRRAELALAAAREQIAALEGSARLRVVALAALAGRSIAELPPLTPRAMPAVGGALPDDVTIDLLARRADITASRWRVEAAEKNLAGARAEYFPDLSINALLGVQSIDVRTLLEYGSRVPQIGAAVHLPIFDEGRLGAQYGGARAAIDAAVSAYQDTVINAAREVGTQAATLAQIDAQRRQRAAEAAAALAMETAAAARVRQGIEDARSELAAMQASIDQRDALLLLDAAAVSADIAFKRALGGGYEASAAPADAQSAFSTHATATRP